MAGSGVTLPQAGGHPRKATFSLVRLPQRKLPRFTLRTIAGETLRPRHRSPDLIEYSIPASGEVSLRW